MDLQLDGKRALITGSTLGIGFAIAKALAEEGVQVVVNGRTQARVSEAQRRIETEISNARIGGVAADLSSPDGVTKVIEAFPEIDILVITWESLSPGRSSRYLTLTGSDSLR